MSRIAPKEKFMLAAINEANIAKKSNNYAIGAVIVKGGKIIARSPNITRTVNDPTQHAEIEVIRKALKKNKNKFLKGAVLYTTHEPCPMCATACVWVRLEGVVFGASMDDMINFSKNNANRKWKWRTVKITAEEVFSKGWPKVKIIGGFMRDSCVNLFHS